MVMVNRHIALASALLGVAAGLDNGAARTPPMAWSSWNAFHCKINSSQLLSVGDALVSSGMLAAGYSSVNIDDCWPLRERDATGLIVADPTKFPEGMDGFSRDLASKGIGLGIYTAHGNKTCQGFPGSLGHEKRDAETYKKWNVTFVKNDWCWHHEEDQSKHLNAFNAMRDALKATGVPMVHSIHWNYDDTPGPNCDRGVDCPLPLTANMWRIGGDIGPKWGSVLRLLDINTNKSAGASPGSWNDMDMLEVGNGMTQAQDQAHFTIWCVMASPLIAGNDLRTMSPATTKILTNRWAISVNQDKLGKQATLIGHTQGASTQVWAKPLATPAGAWAVAFINRAAGPATAIKLPLSALPAAAAAMGVAASHGNGGDERTSGGFEVLDLWQDGKNLGSQKVEVEAQVPGTAAAFYKLVPATPQ